MRYFVWEEGRQKSGYRKMRLAHVVFPTWIRERILGFDAYVLDYPEGAEIPEHTDPVEGYRHYRVNCIVRQCESGGEFKGTDTIIDWSWLKVFPSDRPHSVSKIIKGTRRVVSFGICVNRTTRKEL